MMSIHKLRTFLCVLTILLLAVPAARAHETDQFTPPDKGREMADVGGYINDLFVQRLQQAVNRVNTNIRRAVEDAESLRTPARGHGKSSRPRPSRQIDPQAVLAVAHSPDGMAEAVWQSFGPAVDLIEEVNTTLHSDAMARRHPGKLPAYRATDEARSVYDGLYFILDPRTAFRLYHATSFKSFGTYMGADKVGHLTDMGYLYFKAYRNALGNGATREEAMKAAVKLGSEGAISEKGLLGNLTAGAYSNADLASNYVGCLFYRNLTEPVVLEGRLRQPMLVREGQYWRLADFVTDDPQFAARFISDHFDESLNPSLFQAIIRPTLREKVAERTPALLNLHADRYQGQNPQSYFKQLALTLSTYYGRDYGHSGHFNDLIGIWNTLPEDADSLARSETE